MLRLRNALLSLLMALGIVLGLQAPAMAAAGTIRVCVMSISTASIYVTFTNGYSTWVNRGQCAGEGTTINGGWEPSFFTLFKPGCYEWWINTGSHTKECAPTNTYTRNIHPGSGFSGSWTAYIKRLS